MVTITSKSVFSHFCYNIVCVTYFLTRIIDMNTIFVTAFSFQPQTALQRVYHPIPHSPCSTIYTPILPTQSNPYKSTKNSCLYSASLSTSTDIQQQGKGSGILQTTIKKMRGVSISVGYDAQKNLTPMDFEILSLNLRKAKACSIWTCELNSLEAFYNEQQTAKGNFPGPCPIIFTGENEKDWSSAVEKGASAIVVNAEQIADGNISIPSAVDIICRVNSVEDIQKVQSMGYNYAFLVSGVADDETLRNMLSILPKTSIVIASLQAMQVSNNEISRGKELSSLHTSITTSDTSKGSKIDGLWIESACVGDTEDIQYTSFVIDSIGKKSSSQFRMTGLTGSANGHFGVSDSSYIEVRWRRNS